jgi:hypothetical protein
MKKKLNHESVRMAEKAAEEMATKEFMNEIISEVLESCDKVIREQRLNKVESIIAAEFTSLRIRQNCANFILPHDQNLDHDLFNDIGEEPQPIHIDSWASCIGNLNSFQSTSIYSKIFIDMIYSD